METYIWFGLFIAFVLAEVSAPGLISIWFALASGILALTSKYIDSTMNEIYIFIALSGAFLVLTRPLSKKILSKREYKLENRIIEQTVEIREVFENGDYEVKLDGKYWKAKSNDKLEVGDLASVEGIEGNKLLLNKIS